MNAKRKKFEDGWISFLKDGKVDKRNIELYEKWFASLTDEMFTEMVKEIASGNLVLPVYSYPMDGDRIDYNLFKEIGKKLGIVWYERVLMTDPVTGETSLSESKALILRFVARRLKQHLLKKRSTAKRTDIVDVLSGQVTGASKSGSLSNQEITILNAIGAHNSILEAIKVRGGDAGAEQIMLDQLEETGEFNMAPILDADTRPQILDTIYYILRARMLENNI